jgi:CO/xanthine dehydrogenase Mo-binding subunit
MRYGAISSKNPIKNMIVDTASAVNSGGIGGSRSISGTGPNVRAAAVAARQALLGLASAKLGVPVAGLTVSNGVVTGGGSSVKYGDLVGGKLLNVKTLPATQPGQNGAKQISQYKLVGTRVPRVDVPDKLTGKYTYVHNLRIPGMWHGRIIRPRGQGAYGNPSNVPVSVDESSIKNIPGVQIVRKGNFLAVVAEHEYAAVQAASQLKVKWQSVPILPGSGNLFSNMKKQEAAGKVTTRVTSNTGNLERDLAASKKVVSATFMHHYQSHVPIGPGCAIADVKSDSATVWSNTQNPHSLVTDLAATLGFTDPSKVEVIFYEGSSSYGNGGPAFDIAESAAIMSQAVGKPVRSQWMRWDEHGWTHMGPGIMTEMTAGIDDKGNLLAFQGTQYLQPSTSLFTSRELIGHPLPNDGLAGTNDENLFIYYQVPSRRLVAKSLPLREGYFHVGTLRAPAAVQTAFATEQLMDMLAIEAGQDSLAFRLQNMQKDEENQRWSGVLQAVAKAANWQPRVSGSQRKDGANIVYGRGIAMGTHGASPAATIAEIEVNKKTGKIRVLHAYAAQDSGLVINPGLVENQMSGNLIMGTSRALYEQVVFNKERITSVDWSTYPLLRFKDAPNVTTVIVQNQKPSTGSGEPPQVSVAAAIGNAFHDATGVRLHEAPMTPGRVRAALKAAKA